MCYIPKNQREVDLHQQEADARRVADEIYRADDEATTREAVRIVEEAKRIRIEYIERMPIWFVKEENGLRQL